MHGTPDPLLGVRYGFWVVGTNDFSQKVADIFVLIVGLGAWELAKELGHHETWYKNQTFTVD